MTKRNHNKRRNTGFLYHILVREYSKAVVNEDKESQNKAIELLKEHFRKGTELKKELELYKAILETTGMEKNLAQKLVDEVRRSHSVLDKKKIYKNQTKLINAIHKGFAKGSFQSFVPNYKTMATIYQVLHSDLPINKKIVLESKLIDDISRAQEEKEEMKPIDALTYKTFVRKFNEKYSTSILKEQKELFGHFILSFADNGIEFKTYLNEEIGRLKGELNSSLKDQKDKETKEKTKKIIKIIENFKNIPISDNLVTQVVRIQELVYEFKATEKTI